MLEILAIIFFSRRIGTFAYDKGYSKGLFVFLTIVFWLTGEFTGGIVGYLILQGGLGAYLFALMGAALGCGMIYLIVSVLEDKNPVDKGDAEWKKQNNPSQAS